MYFQLTAGTLGFLSHCNRLERTPFEFQRESWDSSRVEGGESTLISRGVGELGALLELRRETRGSSQVDSYLGEPMELHKGG